MVFLFDSTFFLVLIFINPKRIEEKEEKMKKKFIWLLISTLMAASLVLASCGPAEEEEEEEVVIPPGEEEEVVVPPEEEEEVKPPTGGKWYDYHGTPEYGGTLIWRIMADIPNFDRHRARDSVGVTYPYTEGFFMSGWSRPREECPYQAGFTPFDCREGLLAEKWEIIGDYMTYRVHLRKGIHWQDIPPVNGRELTAYDVEYGWHRITGLGSGFEKSPYNYFKGMDDFESIVAIDKYTIDFNMKFTCPGWEGILGGISFCHATPKESIDMYGDLNDWTRAIGTGPFIMDDYVAGTSYSYVRNPNYWGHDQRYPENQVPYLDGMKYLVIPDSSTAYAALRTGKIAMIPNVDWEQAAAFEKSNPEILQVPFPASGWGVSMRIDKDPFTDIRVRQVLNMAVDRQEIAATYYGGRSGGEMAYSNYGPSAGPYYTPFDEWSEDLQYHNTYNPSGAIALLAEAGYPNGFKTNMVVSSTSDLALPQIIKGYFADIGVDMEIKIVEATVFFATVNINKGHDQMVWGMQGANAGGGWLPQFTSKMPFSNLTMIADPQLDELIDREALYPFDSEGKISYNKQADMYAMNLYLTVNTVPGVSYCLYQPWLKGYSGEMPTEFGVPVIPWFARWWIDQDLKKSMGH